MNNKTFNKLELVSEFKSIPLFSALDDEQLLRVITQGCNRTLPAGSILFLHGESAEYFYYLKKGQIQLFLDSGDGNEKVFDVIHQGQLFAEAVTFFEEQRYPVNSRGMQDSELFAIKIPVFRSILKESTETCFRLLAIMSKRLHTQLLEIYSLTLHNATYRLVSHFLKSIPDEFHDDAQVPLHYSKSVLASRLSIKPETLSRILSRLKEKEIIEIQGHNIVLHNVDALRKYLNDENQPDFQLK